jgi:hypothetical protein
MARYCAPELLNAKGFIRVEIKPTNKSDVYSLSMIIVEVHRFSESMIRPGSDYFRFQLVTGKIPFSEHVDHNVVIFISSGMRPRKPFRFDAPGMTPAVWKIAEKCWHEKAEERPEVNTVLQHLENIAGGKGAPTPLTRRWWGVFDGWVPVLLGP